MSDEDRAVASSIVNDYRSGRGLLLPLMFLIGGAVLIVGGVIAWSARHAFPSLTMLLGPMWLLGGGFMWLLRRRIVISAARQGL